MKKLLSLLLVVAMLVTCVSIFAACAEKNVTIALITDKGDIDDKSFNQGAWEGVLAYAKDNNLKENKDFKYYKPNEGTDEAYLAAIDLAVSNGAKIIVTPGFLFEVPVYLAQTKYPTVNFVLLDGAPHSIDYKVFKTEKNVASVFYAEEEAGFLAGYAAVKDGFRKLGFMGGMAVPAVQSFGNGFIQGADKAAAELALADGAVTIKLHYTGDFAENAANKATALAMYNDGTEVIFACGGSVGKSVMSAATEAKKKVIGVDVDQSADSDTVITSATKGLSASVVAVLKTWADGTFGTAYGAKSTYFNAKVNGVGLPVVAGAKDTDKLGRFTNFTVADYKASFAKVVAGTYAPLRKFGQDKTLTLEEIVAQCKISAKVALSEVAKKA